jgi:hypothetical protein
MYQRRRLERMLASLLGHSCVGQATKLLIHQRQQLRGSPRFATFDGMQKSRGIRHVINNIIAMTRKR